MVLTTALAAQLARALPRVHHFAPRVKQVHTGGHHPKGEFARHAQLGTGKTEQVIQIARLALRVGGTTKLAELRFVKLVPPGPTTLIQNNRHASGAQEESLCRQICWHKPRKQAV